MLFVYLYLIISVTQGTVVIRHRKGKSCANERIVFLTFKYVYTSVICDCIVNKASSVRVASVSELSNGRGYFTFNYSRREFVHYVQFQRGSIGFASHCHGE